MRGKVMLLTTRLRRIRGEERAQIFGKMLDGLKEAAATLANRGHKPMEPVAAKTEKVLQQIIQEAEAYKERTKGKL